LRAPVFLDSSALSDLRNLINEGVHKSDSLVLLATKGVLMRPWCLLELLETARQNIPVVIVRLGNGGFQYESARRVVENLESDMEKLNPAGLAFVRRRIGTDLGELKGAIIRALDANEQQALVFDSHASDKAVVAILKDVVEHMARATRRRIVWDDAWDRSTSHRSTTMADRSMRASEAGAGGKSPSHRDRPSIGRSGSSSLERLKWALSNTLMLRAQEVTNSESAVFVCCSRADAVGHARVLRSELAIKLGRGCAVGGSPDSAAFIPESELIVVLLTKKLMTDPLALFEIWTALQRGLPLATVVVSGGGYDYDEASACYEDLHTALDGVRFGAASELLAKLPDGTTIAAVGEQLHASLTALIALSWSPFSTRNHLDSVVDEIFARVPKAKKKRRSLARRPTLVGMEPLHETDARAGEKFRLRKIVQETMASDRGASDLTLPSPNRSP